MIDELQKEVQNYKIESAQNKVELDAYKKKLAGLEEAFQKLRVEHESTRVKLVAAESNFSAADATVKALERESKLLLEKAEEWRDFALNQAGVKGAGPRKNKRRMGIDEHVA